MKDGIFAHAWPVSGKDEYSLVNNELFVQVLPLVFKQEMDALLMGLNFCRLLKKSQQILVLYYNIKT